MQTLVKWGAYFSLYAALSIASATEVVIEGSAPIRNGDIGQARELASRRALASAAELKSAHVSAQSIVNQDAVFNTVQVKSSGCTENAERLSERISGDELTVVMSVNVKDDSSCYATCKGNYTNRLLVTGFDVEYPNQLQGGESLISNRTAVELAKKIAKHGHLLADFDVTEFPYASPTRAPEESLTPKDTESHFSVIARKFRAQYVLSGIYRDISLRGYPWPIQNRRIEIEAFVHDGVNGEVLARRRFFREATGFVMILNDPEIGSAEFYAGNFGSTWGGMLDEISAWAGAQASCLPFIARVLKVSGNQIHIDGGAESGLSNGDTLTIHSWKEPPVRSVTGRPLGKEKSARSSASIRAVYPRFSVIQLTDAPTSFEIKAGDVLYAQ